MNIISAPIFSTLLFAIAGCALIIITILIFRQRKAFLNRSDIYRSLGFHSCQDIRAQVDFIRQTVYFLVGDKPRDDLWIHHSMIRETNGIQLYFFMRSGIRFAGESGYERDTILFPIRRTASQHILVRIGDKPTTKQLKVMSRLDNAITGSRRRGTGKSPATVLKIPPDLDGGPIFSILGPPKSNVYDLLDRDFLHELQNAPKFGIGLFRANQNWALVSLEHNHQNTDPKLILEYVERLSKL